MFSRELDYRILIKKEVKRLTNQVNYPEGLDESDSTELSFTHHIPNDTSLTAKLKTWYMHYGPAPECTNAILQILNGEGIDVPNNVEELNRHRENDTQDQRVVMDIDCGHLSNSESGSWVLNKGVNAQPIKTEHFKDTNSVIRELQKQQCNMNAKLNHMIREIAKVNVRLNEKTSVENEVQRSSNQFPIANVTILADFENSLNEGNSDSYILTIKRIINNDHLNKSLLRILSKDILLEHNLDGRQKKLALNAYPKLLNLLYRSYNNYETFSEFTWDLKHAMKRIKNRFHKANCLSRKTILSSQADPLLISAKFPKKNRHDVEDNFF